MPFLNQRESENDHRGVFVIRYMYRKVPKFSDARELGCNQPKIPTKRPNLRVFNQKDVNGIANDQTAPLQAV